MINNNQLDIHSQNPVPSEPRVAVVIIAHNEAAVIEPLVLSVKNSLFATDQAYVIADNCTDDTVPLAARAGAEIRIRNTGGPVGKGAALQWFVNQERTKLDEYDLLVILDADSQIPLSFVADTKAAFSERVVVQGFVQPVNFNASPISTLSALSEIMEQHTFDRIRARLGWPVRLRGTGMLIPPKLLFTISDRIQTEVEDVALSLLFASIGVQIKKSEMVTVFDPKPEGSASASKQRARWFRGQWTAVWLYRSEIFRLLVRGPAGWSILISLFLKPRWLQDAIAILFAILFYFHTPLLSLLCISIVAFDISCLVYTLAHLQDKKIFLKALLYFPGFIVMWLRGFALAFQKYPWRRARD